MTDDLADQASDDRALRRPWFTVCAEPPSLLHLTGELDMAGAPTLATALEPLIMCGGTIGLNLAALTFMDSTGINALCAAARQVGERGRIVVFRPPPSGSACHGDRWHRRHRPHQRRRPLVR